MNDQDKIRQLEEQITHLKNLLWQTLDSCDAELEFGQVLFDEIKAAIDEKGEDVLSLDASRYRWLALHAGEIAYPDQWMSKEWLDAAIDAAMRATPPGAVDED